MEENLDQLASEEVEYEEWQNVEVDGKKRMRVVKKSKPKGDFKTAMLNEYEKFLGHCSRVRDQYTALQTLKTKLPEKSAIIQIDFAENFSCQTADEIQSAYWNSTMVTIHPVVVYFKEGSRLSHKNFAFVSDVNHHNSTAVLAIIQKLIPIVTEMVPNLESVHYWTDSPSSRYRNRYMFHVVQKHEEMFGVCAVWTYFESGHGKSVCDGVGGACQRMAGEAVRQGKVSIQDGKEFFKWAQQNERSISYQFYSQEDYDQASKAISAFNASAVPGTMKLHTVKTGTRDNLLHRNTSCYCDECIHGHCNSWSEVVEDVKDPVCKTGDYVAAVYEKQWYVGQVLDVDDSDQTVEIKFMEKKILRGKTQFKWPQKEDVIWLSYGSVLKVVGSPVPVDRFQRFYAIPLEDIQTVQNMFI